MTTDCTRCPLRKLPCFEDVSENELKFLQRFKHGEIIVDAGMPLLAEGTRSPQLFTALEGMGVRYKLLENGNRQVLNFVLPGDFLGLQAGVMKQMTHSVKATTAMKLCVFDRDELWLLFKDSPEQAYDLTWIAAVEEHFMGEALASVGQMSAVERISWGLLRFFHRCERLHLTEGNRCPFPFRQQDLADAVGLSLVHTNKTLMKMRDNQLLSLSDGSLAIHDFERLEQISPLELPRNGVRPLI